MQAQQQHFHVRHEIPHLEIIQSEAKAKGQDERVRELFIKTFEKDQNATLDKFDVKDALPDIDELSVGRAICNNYKSGYITKEGKHMGRKGATVTLYRLAPPVNTQYALAF